MHTEAVEDYLKAIFELENRADKVSTTALSEHLDVKPASVTGMVKKLAQLNLVRHERYQGVVLTDAGRKIALEVIRHHRLVELYLAEALNVPWDRVHEEAEKWEHVLSEDLEDRMDELLGYPTTDPHGAPIPARDGSMVTVPQTRLSDMEAGQMGVISEVSDHDPKLLRYLGEMNLYPDTPVFVLETAPFEGPLTIQIGEAATGVTLGREVAKHILMTKIDSQ